MSQNTSHAVMAQRVEPHDSLDYFPTPPWATRALCEWLQDEAGEQIGGMWALDPACGEGHMVRPLAEYFDTVGAADIHPYGHGDVRDFLFGEPTAADWTITNPPFRLAEQFIEQAIKGSHRGVAMLVRTSFLESVGRYERLFSRTPPTHVLQFVERVPMHKGRLVKDGVTATAYCWLVWIKGDFGAPTQLRWLAPCRKRLERASDYAESVA
jgi:hypothetical protein